MFVVSGEHEKQRPLGFGCGLYLPGDGSYVHGKSIVVDTQMFQKEEMFCIFSGVFDLSLTIRLLV